MRALTAAACLLACALSGRAETLWVPAGQALRLSGPIAFGTTIGIVEDGAIGDFLVSTVRVTEAELDGLTNEYQLELSKELLGEARDAKDAQR